MEIYLQIFLTSTLYGGEWSHLCFGRFTLGEKLPHICRIEVWVYPTAGLNKVAKRKILILAVNKTTVVHPAASHFTDRANPAHINITSAVNEHRGERDMKNYNGNFMKTCNDECMQDF
jgi:hypothetical protein